MSQWNLQTALYTRLSGDGPLSEILTGGVHDHVAATTQFPYAVIGRMRTASLDTQAHAGMETIVTIHSYSTETGMKEIRNVMAKIRQSLHDAEFTIPGHALILCQETSSDSYLDADGETRHGVQVLRIITEAI